MRDVGASIAVECESLDHPSLPMIRRDSIRPLVLCCLILAEGMALGIAFDSDSLRQLPHGWWTWVLAFAGKVMPLAAAIATGLLLLAGPRIAESLRSNPSAARTRSQDFYLAGHVAAFAGLFLASMVVFGRTSMVMRHPTAWIITWTFAAASTGILWLAALLPMAAMQRLVRQLGGVLLAAALCSVLAFAAGQYTQQWWTPFRSATLRGAYGLLHLVDSSAWVDVPNWGIGAGREFGVEINPQCSGYEGIGLIWVFLAAYSWIFRGQLRFPQALLLFPAATLAIYAANILRIAFLVEIGGHASSAVALGGFHSYAGMLLFSAIALGAGAVAHRSPFISKVQSAPRERGRNPVAPWLAPFLVVLATGQITGLISSGSFDRFYAVRIVAGAAVLWYYRDEYRQLEKRFSLLAVLVGLLVFVIWIVPAVVHPAREAHPPLSNPWFMLWIVSRLIGYIALTPIVEELAFRGYLARRIVSADFETVNFANLTWPAIALSSAVFAGMHGHVHVIAAFIAGMGYGLLARRCNRLSDAVVAHAVTNAAIAAYAIYFQAWSVAGS